MFEPNITVSSDAVSCIYQVNGSTPVSMTKTGTACMGQTERFKTLDSGYNITFNTTDASGNVGSMVFRLNVSDTTAPDKGTIAASSVGSTTAVITITSVNESVNATVWYGTSSTSLTSSATETDFNITQTVSLSDLTANTQYYFNVTLRDFNGNVNRSGTYNFVTDVAAAAAAAEAAAGGGGAAATVSQVADSKAQLWNTIPAGSSISLDIDKATIAVTSVAVNDVKSELKNVDLEVASLKENPVSTDAAALVYQYFKINKNSIADSDATSLKISFRVTKSWLTENSLTSGDISLYRYKSGWNALTTRVTGTDDTYVNYEADTPGFSSFAVGVKSGVEVEEEVPEEVPGEVPEEEAAPPEAVEKPKAVEAPTKAPVAWIIAAVVIILGIILIVAYQKKKQS
jgi:PGF-pre-PGF domain-containing protein